MIFQTLHLYSDGLLLLLSILKKKYLDFILISLGACFLLNKKEALSQGYNVRKVICSCVYSAYTLKPVLSGRNL